MTLALMIINPMLLYAGTALASIPVIIHLLNRLRYKHIVWAAMEFLLAAHRKNARRIRLEHLILLIIRTLIILLLAAALGRPILEGMLARLGRSAVHRIVVLDDSYSMGVAYGAGGGENSLVKEATKLVEEKLLKTFDERDGISLVTAGSKPRVRIDQASFNREQVLDKLQKIAGSDSTTDMIGALTDVKRIINESTLEQKVVYILTDNTKTAWDDPSNKDLRGLAQFITDKAGLVVIDLGRMSKPNLALKTLEPEHPVVTSNVLAAFRVQVENQSDQAVDGVMVQMTVNDQPDQPVTFGRIGPRKIETRRWTYVFDHPGEQKVVGTLKGGAADVLAADNRRFLALNVKDAINVLLVDGEPKAEAASSETNFLRMALDPRGPSTERVTAFQVRTIPDTELAQAQFDTLDVVALANVATISDPQAERLKRFVRDGGSLMIFVGDQIRPADYNRLYENGLGLMPATLTPTPLGSLEPGPEQEKKRTTFDVKHFDHPALAVFKERGSGAGLEAAVVKKYYQMKLPLDAKETGVILSFQDSNPAIVEKKYGRGRVIAWATTAGAKWTNFPLTLGYLPLIHELMDYLSPNVLWRYNRLVDEDVVLPVAVAESQQSMTLKTPSKGDLTLKPVAQGPDRFVLDLGAVTESGLHILDMGKGGTRLLAVNVDTTKESNLDHLSKNELVTQLGGVPVVYAEGREGLAVALEEQHSAGGWARNLLYAMLGLLLLETFLAWFFNRGR